MSGVFGHPESVNGVPGRFNRQAKAVVPSLAGRWLPIIGQRVLCRRLISILSVDYTGVHVHVRAKWTPRSPTRGKRRGEQVAVPDAIMKNKEAIDTLTKRHEFIEKKVRGRSVRLQKEGKRAPRISSSHSSRQILRMILQVSLSERP